MFKRQPGIIFKETHQIFDNVCKNKLSSLLWMFVWAYKLEPLSVRGKV